MARSKGVSFCRDGERTSILGVDPGYLQTALVWIADKNEVLRARTLPNEEAREAILKIASMGMNGRVLVAIEGIQPMGMVVGAEVFDTCMWVGRFVEVCNAHGIPYWIVYRSQVKVNICGDSRAKDPNIRRAIVDRYGGESAGIGRKASPGPLYEVKGDAWSALAIALTARDAGATVSAETWGC